MDGWTRGFSVGTATVPASPIPIVSKSMFIWHSRLLVQDLSFLEYLATEWHASTALAHSCGLLLQHAPSPSKFFHGSYDHEFRKNSGRGTRKAVDVVVGR
jgi:hypothetical protein